MRRRILIDVNHPAQVYNFMYVYYELTKLGYEVYWTSIDRDILLYLLDTFTIPYIKMESPPRNFIKKLLSLFKTNFKAYTILRKYKIDLVISRMSLFFTLPCFFLRIKHFGLCDTESARENKMISILSTLVFSSTSFHQDLGKNHIRFNGNIELFYLNPNRFTPSPVAYKYLGIEPNMPYILMRFVSWDAFHDVGLSGFSDANKVMAVREFSKYAKVFISSEKELPAELEPYRIRIPPEKMHDVMASAKLFFGESATMASESAVLGVPAIYLDKKGRGYTDEEEKYGLVNNYSNSTGEQFSAIEKGLELLRDEDLGERIKKNHQLFLGDKIDPTSWLVWFIDNYPKSYRIMRENPDYQFNFK